MRRKNNIAALLGCLVMTVASYGDVIVTNDDCNPIPSWAYQVVNLGNNHFNVIVRELYSDTFSYYVIHPTNPGVIIDNIFIDATGPPQADPAIVKVMPSCDNPDLRIDTVHNILTTATGLHILNRVEIDGNVGQISVDIIGDVLLGGDVTGDIISTAPDNDSWGILKVDAVGNIFGDLLTPLGRIAFISADGDIGTPGSPILIEAKHHIRHITQAQNLYADINARVNGGAGTISRIIVDRFVGSLQARAMSTQPSGGELRFNEQLAATITFGESYSGGNRTIQVPVGGLTSQIIFNADNVGGVWGNGAEVWIGFEGDPDQIILSGPGYTNTAESLGGGSVGLAPFDLHDESCDPPNGETVLLQDTDPDLEVKLRHYGPITLNANAPVTIESREACTTDEFVLLSSTDFDYSVDPADGNSLLVSGALGADGFEIGYEYRLIATADLMCDQVDGNPAVSWDSADYRVTVRPACPADLDRDCAVGVKDLLILLGAWGPCEGCPADIDCDTDVGLVDLLALLGWWGNCACAEGPPPPSLEDAVEDAGLEYPEDWDEFEDVMTDPESSQEDKDNYYCWMDHYLNHCTGMACTPPSCPGDAPFGHHE